MSLIAVATGKRLLLINPKVGDKMLTKKMDDILEEAPKTNDVMGMFNVYFSFSLLILNQITVSIIWNSNMVRIIHYFFRRYCR